MFLWMWGCAVFCGTGSRYACADANTDATVTYLK